MNTSIKLINRFRFGRKKTGGKETSSFSVYQENYLKTKKVIEHENLRIRNLECESNKSPYLKTVLGDFNTKLAWVIW